MLGQAPLSRWEELLADRTGGCLPLEERAELARLLDENPQVDPHEFDLAAAALQLALSPASLRPLPAGFQRRLQASADAWFAVRPASRAAAAAREPRGALLRSRWSGWAAAAALALVAAGSWLARPAPGTSSDPASARSALLERDDVGHWTFTATDDPLAGDASGDVVWSTSEQRGYMLFRGLRPNDPTREQYQLWIFDGARTADAPNAAPPVDGGVFDVEGGGDVVVPIDSKLTVGEPTLFAVTLEQPGGVVVSAQKHVLLVAATQG